MKRKLDCILLVDDSHEDNRYHEIIIKEMDIVNRIEFALNGIEALDYLKREDRILPELIFLDINMPRMNGWEFLEQYKYLDPAQKAKVVVMILTTSANPDDIKKAKEIEDITGFETKPLSREIMMEILNQHFQDYL